MNFSGVSYYVSTTPSLLWLRSIVKLIITRERSVRSARNFWSTPTHAWIDVPMVRLNPLVINVRYIAISPIWRQRRERSWFFRGLKCFCHTPSWLFDTSFLLELLYLKRYLSNALIDIFEKNTANPPLDNRLTTALIDDDIRVTHLS